jgi:hypothetical protein
MDTPSIAELVAKLVVGLAALPLIAASIIILRKKGCVAEINVIWYAFSLILVIWWSINFALYLEIISLPWAPPELVQAQDIKPKPPFDQNMSSADRAREQKAREEQIARIRRLHENPEAWGRYLYQNAKRYLTDTRAELGLVATILIVTIAPQLLNYILAGFSGCAATPRYVWQFEKIATWSLIKFLAAFGGVSVAGALGIYQVAGDLGQEGLDLEEYLEDLLWGVGAVGLAFFVAVFQVYTLEAAHALGDAWPQKPKSWPYRIHRFFTRNLRRDENTRGNEAQPATLDARQIWNKLTPAQQQEVGALVMWSLLEGRLAANADSQSRAAFEATQLDHKDSDTLLEPK